MRQTIKHFWRVFKTGLGYFFFGSGALILSCVLTVLRLTAEPVRTRKAARRLIHLSCRLYIRLLCLLGLLRIDIKGEENLALRGGFLVVANHPTLIDVLLIFSLFPDIDCVAKQELWRNPCLRGLLKAASYIPSENSLEFLEQCADRIRAGQPLLLFPEATRSLPDKMRPFRRGASAIAAASGARILPVMIRCNPPTLSKSVPWYHIPPRPPLVSLHIFNPPDISGIRAASKNEFVFTRKLSRFLQEFFEDRLEDAERSGVRG